MWGKGKTFFPVKKSFSLPPRPHPFSKKARYGCSSLSQQDLLKKRMTTLLSLINYPYWEQSLLFLRLPLLETVQHMPDRQSAESRFLMVIVSFLWKFLLRRIAGGWEPLLLSRRPRWDGLIGELSHLVRRNFSEVHSLIIALIWRRPPPHTASADRNRRDSETASLAWRISLRWRATCARQNFRHHIDKIRCAWYTLFVATRVVLNQYNQSFTKFEALTKNKPARIWLFRAGVQ